MPDSFFRRLPIEPTSIDAENRTAKLTWSTGAAVQRSDYQGPYVEVLSMPGADLTRLNGGAPLLNAHRGYGVETMLGVVQSAAIESGKGSATVKFSARAEIEPIWQDVRAGIIRNVSVGYTVQEWQVSIDPATGARTKTAIRWQPFEISLVPVPADPGATVRAKEVTMPEQIATPSPSPAPAAVVPNPTPAVTPAQPGAETRAAINAEIRAIVEQAGLEPAFANRQIDAGATADQTRAAAFTAMQERSRLPIGTQRIQIGQDHNDPEVRCRQMGEALYARTDLRHQLSEPARQYAHMSFVDLARESLRMRGMPVTGISHAELITRSLHTTSDFAIILGDAVGRTLRAAYQAAPSALKQLGRETTAQDFRKRYKIMLGEAPTLLEVPESGEYKRGSMAQAKESYALKTYGRIFGISRQALINDDLGAFSDLSARLGVAAAGFEAQTLVDLLIANAGLGPTMDDGNTLFHAGHHNIAGTGAALTDDIDDALAALSDARLAMRRQTGLSGSLIDVPPKFVLISPEQETAAEKLLTQINATAVADVNPLAGKLTLVVENRLTDATRWYLTADPARIDGLEYAYLAGAPGPQIATRNGFDVDGVETKVSLDFGCGFVEHRGWFTNSGQHG
jgi:phage major head subunit gpT-like protein